MSDVLDSPVALAATAFETVGKTVAEVAFQVEMALRAAEIEHEYASVANSIGDSNEAVYGLRPSSPWPGEQSRSRRLALSVERGLSEGWIVRVDFVRLVDAGEPRLWQSLPVLRMKTLSRSQAWSIAAVVSRLLDID